MKSHQYANEQTVGDWDGNEAMAAQQFNVIVREIDRRCGDDDDAASTAVHYAWDAIGSDERLLLMSKDELCTFAAKFV